MTDTTQHSRTDQCSDCGSIVYRSRSSAAKIRCLSCRRKNPNHGHPSTYEQGCRCRPCTDAKAAKSREYAQRRKEEGRPLHLGRRRVTAECAGCGTRIEVRADILKQAGNYCSHECHTRAQTDPNGYRATRRDRDRSIGSPGSVRRRATTRAANAAKGTSGGNLIWVQGNCIVCATPYLSPGAASRYCSPRCRNKNRGTRSYGLTWLDRMALYARDNWTCQICRDPVDYTADPNSDWYPSIDHIVPRSHGGTHEWENLRLAHTWCNSVRGDMSHYTDSDLAPSEGWAVGAPLPAHGHPAA